MVVYDTHNAPLSSLDTRAQYIPGLYAGARVPQQVASAILAVPQVAALARLGGE